MVAVIVGVLLQNILVYKESVKQLRRAPLAHPVSQDLILAGLEGAPHLKDCFYGLSFSNPRLVSQLLGYPVDEKLRKLWLRGAAGLQLVPQLAFRARCEAALSATLF